MSNSQKLSLGPVAPGRLKEKQTHLLVLLSLVLFLGARNTRHGNEVNQNCILLPCTMLKSKSFFVCFVCTKYLLWMVWSTLLDTLLHSPPGSTVFHWKLRRNQNRISCHFTFSVAFHVKVHQRFFWSRKKKISPPVTLRIPHTLSPNLARLLYKLWPSGTLVPSDQLRCPLE